MLRVATAFALATALLTASIATAVAEVRFGNNVRIGGHDVSNQTFNKKRRGKYIITRGKPKNAGCRWRKNRDGSRTKVCRLQRKKRK